MAEPRPIFVTPSTTIVQVNTLQTPYTPVLLNGFNYPGQIVTVLDGTSSVGVLYSSIVVSTNGGTTFLDSSISTLINQPQGFLTAQAQTPNLWALLNSFPFRNQYLSAGLYTLNTSTFTTATLSSIQQYTNSMNVDELVVSGNFVQSSPITFNTTVSTFGSVDLYSSFSVWQSTFFSSGLSTVGAVRLFSSLTVDGNLITASTFQALSTMFVSGSVSVLNFVSAGSIQLSSGLVSKSLFVTDSTLTSVLTAGTVDVLNLTSILSSVNVGEDFTAGSSRLESLSTFSSFAVAGPLDAFQIKVANMFSTQGALAVLGHLSTGDTFLKDEVHSGSNVRVGGDVTIGGYVSTQQLTGTSLTIGENLNVESSLPVTAKSVNLGTNLFLGNLSTLSLSVAGVLSTTASASLYSTVQANAFSNGGYVSTLSLSTLGDTVVGKFMTLGDVNLFRSTYLNQDLVVLSTSFWNQIPVGPPNLINGDVSIQGNLIVQQILTLSSIILPSSVVANNFTVSTLYVGDIGIISSATISSIEASSIGTGGIVKPEFTMDMANSLFTTNLSTFFMSTILFEGKTNPQIANVPNTFFQITSSLGVGLTASTNTFQVNPLATTTSNLFAAQYVSSLQVIGGTLTGILQGNAALMSNVRFPIQLSTSIINVSSITSEFLGGSSLFLSTLITETFTPFSTLKIGDLVFFGNADNSDVEQPLPSFSTPYIMSVLPGNSFIFPPPPGTFIRLTNSNIRLNTLLALGNNLGIDSGQFRGGILNYDKIPGFENTSDDTVISDSNIAILAPEFVIGDSESPPATFVLNPLAISLAIGDTLRVDNLVGQPIFFFSLQANNLILNGGLDSSRQEFIALRNLGSTYVSSGSIVLGSNTQFVPDERSFVQFSTNTIQPFLSTLQFNSTLFVSRDRNKVGVNTEPYYTLDVNGTLYASTSILMNTSSIIQNQLTINQSYPSFWVGCVSQNSLEDNLLIYSEDGMIWSAVPYSFEFGTIFYDIGTNGGLFSNNPEQEFQNPLTFTQAPRWVVVGTNFNGFSPGLAYYSAGSIFKWNPVDFLPPGDYEPVILSCTSVEFNGAYWVMTTQIAEGKTSPRASLWRSEDGITWSDAVSGGFGSQGQASAWNGSLWVAVGLGDKFATSGETILYSGDGSNWSNSVNGFESKGGNDIVWTGKNWVAVGLTRSEMGDPNTGILYSTNGSNWTEPLSCPITGLKTAIGWNGSRLVVSGEGGFVYSDDYGINWEICTGSTFFYEASIVWNGSYWLASGFSGITKSLDGISWVATDYTNVTIGLAYNSNAVPSLAIGQSTLQYVSTSATSFPGLNVAVGVPFVTDTMFFSENGSNWSPALSGALDVTGLCVAFGGETWVAGGGDSTKSNIVYSSDGKNWTKADVGSGGGGFPDVRAVLYGGTTWVAGLGGQFNFNSIIYSTDGALTWNPITNSYTTPSETYAIGYGPSYYDKFANTFIIGGTAGTSLYYSTDGANWTNDTPINFFQGSATIHEFLYVEESLGDSWFVVGTDEGTTTTIKTSADARTWNDVVFDTVDFATAYGIAYDGVGLFVAVGTSGGGGGTIKYSGDGSSWSNAVSGEFNDTGYSVTYNSELSLWIATGINDGTPSDAIRYSSDGSNWSNSSGNDLAIGFGVAATGGFTVPGTIQAYYNQVTFLNNPLPEILSRNISPSLSYGASNFVLNNAVSLDIYQNLIVNSLSTNFTLAISGITQTASTITFQSTLSQTSTLQFASTIFFQSTAQVTGTVFSTVQTTTQQVLSSIFDYAAPFSTLNVAVGYGLGYTTTTISGSISGQIWGNATSAFNIQGVCVAFGGGVWVAGGEDTTGNNILRSIDTETWTAVTGIFPVVNVLLYANDVWVAGLDGVTDYFANNTIVYSTDEAITWNTVLLPNTTPSDKTIAIGYGPTSYTGVYAFLAGGEPGNLLYTSLDGIVWTERTPVNFFDGSPPRLNNLLYANGKWFAAGRLDNFTTGVTLKYSSDGATWSDASFETGDFVEAYGIAYNGTDLFVAVGYTEFDGGTIKYSGDGITWSNAVSGEFTNKGNSVIYNPNLSLWIAAGAGLTDEALLYSSDGSNWTKSTGSLIEVGQGVAWNVPKQSTFNITVPAVAPTLNVASGSTDFLESPPNSNVLSFSEDGITWQPANIGGGTIFEVNSLTFGGNTWLASYIYTDEQDAFKFGILRSGDGKNWTSSIAIVGTFGIISEPLNSIGKFALGGTTWVATLAGTGSPIDDNSILYSTDSGLTWYSVQPPNTTPTSSEGIAYGPTYYAGGNVFVITPGDLTQGLYTSPNGITWTQQEPVNFPSDGFFINLRYTGGLWFGLGTFFFNQSTITYSSDAYTWEYATFETTPFQFAYDIAYDGTGLFVAVGSLDFNGNTIKYSGDGVTWSNAVSGEFVHSGQSVIYNSNLSLWIATGANDFNSNNTVMKYSGDGCNWSDGTTTNFRYGTSLAWSPAGVPLTSSIQSTITFQNVFNLQSTFQVTQTIGNGLNVAVGNPNKYNSNSIYFSQNGSNWSPSFSGAGILGNAVGFGDGKWVVGGANPQENFSTNLLTSVDGRTWNQVPQELPAVNDILYANNTWVAGLEQVISDNTILYSVDNAVTWNTIVTPFSTPDNTKTIAYGPTSYVGGNVFLIAGVSGQFLYTSPNGITWTQRTPVNFFFSIFLDVLPVVYDLLYVNSTWFGAGRGGTSIKYSSDAITWTNATFVTADFTEANSIAYNGSNLFVAVGYTEGEEETIKYSGNGLLWSNAASGQFGLAGYSVIYNSTLSLWIAAGDNDGSNTGALKYSGNGINWSNGTGNSITIFAGLASQPPGIISTVIFQSTFSFVSTVGFIQSTFINYDFTNITETVSTNKVTLYGAFTLGTQYV
jgi:hypothetical protein